MRISLFDTLQSCSSQLIELNKKNIARITNVKVAKIKNFQQKLPITRKRKKNAQNFRLENTMCIPKSANLMKPVRFSPLSG
jgi:UDP-N-acetylmuramyl pentapeptide synthase